MPKKQSDEAKRKIADFRSVARWMNNGERDMAVPLAEAKFYMLKGWKIGRISIQDRKWVHDGRGTEKCVTHDDAMKLTYMGWFMWRG